jgi:hypothetical protein
MNTIQAKYIQLKAIYDQAFNSQNWVQVEAIEDEYLEAEEQLVHWAISQAEATGKLNAEDIQMLRKNWMHDKYRDKIINLALKLTA